MTWIVKFEKPAEQHFAKLDVIEQRQIVKKLDWFCENFENILRHALHADWSGYYKLRVGDWRLVYTYKNQEKLIQIWYLDNRDKVYKRP